MSSSRLAGGVARGLVAPPANPTRCRRGSEDGMVTAETAVVLPVLLLVTVALAWLVGLGVAQVRVVDAARETARAIARDEDPARAVELGQRIAPAGARIEVKDRGSTVVVSVVAAVQGPDGVLRLLPVIEVDASALAAKEER